MLQLVLEIDGVTLAMTGLASMTLADSPVCGALDHASLAAAERAALTP